MRRARLSAAACAVKGSNVAARVTGGVRVAVAAKLGSVVGPLVSVAMGVKEEMVGGCSVGKSGGTAPSEQPARVNIRSDDKTVVFMVLALQSPWVPGSVED